MPGYLVKPTNSVLVQGPHQIVEMKVGANATAAKMLPKIWVIYDAADGSVKEAAADSVAALGVLMEAPDQGIGTAYAVADQCRVVTKGIVLCTYLSSATGCTPGDALATVADGKVGKHTSSNAACIVAKALSTVASGGAVTDVIVELF
jgi:hypothetical protein